MLKLIPSIVMGLGALSLLHIHPVLALVIGMAALIALPPDHDPAIRLREARRVKPAILKSDVDWINESRCPDCHRADCLLAGPSGGMSQNTACEKCLMEFNVHHSFGGGAFRVDRTGPLSEGRARMFGIPPVEYHLIRTRQSELADSNTGTES